MRLLFTFAFNEGQRRTQTIRIVSHRSGAVCAGAPVTSHYVKETPAEPKGDKQTHKATAVCIRPWLVVRRSFQLTHQGWLASTNIWAAASTPTRCGCRPQLCCMRTTGSRGYVGPRHHGRLGPIGNRWSGRTHHDKEHASTRQGGSGSASARPVLDQCSTSARGRQRRSCSLRCARATLTLPTHRQESPRSMNNPP